MPATLAKTQGTHGARGLARTLGRLTFRTVQACLQYRVVGLAAETAFFAIVSLPPMLFGLVGAIGFVTRRLDVTTMLDFQERVISFAGQFLTQQSIEDILVPTMAEVLQEGRFDVVSIGFLIALWSGSRAMAVFVETITIMYGLSGRRGLVRQQALSFLLYLVLMVTSVLVLPLMLTGPDLLESLLPRQLEPMVLLYWPFVVVVSIALLTTIYDLTVPANHHWWSHVPGASWAMLMWLGGSWLLRKVLAFVSGGTSVYGPLAAPIAVLLWLYLIALAVLIGAAVNASLAQVAPHLAGVDRNVSRRIRIRRTDPDDE